MPALEMPGADICRPDKATQPILATTSNPKVRPPFSRTGRHECDDDYPRVVCHLDKRTRVIECTDGIQWAIQTLRGKAGWSSELYFRTKSGLLFYAKSAAPELQALPDRFPERTEKREQNLRDNLSRERNIRTAANSITAAVSAVNVLKTVNKNPRDRLS